MQKGSPRNKFMAFLKMDIAWLMINLNMYNKDGDGYVKSNMANNSVNILHLVFLLYVLILILFLGMSILRKN